MLMYVETCVAQGSFAFFGVQLRLHTFFIPIKEEQEMERRYKMSKGFTLDLELAARLKEGAADSGRSISRYTEMLLSRWIKEVEATGNASPYVKPQSEEVPEKQRIGLTIRRDILKQLEAFAEADFRPFSEYVNLALRRALEMEE